MKKIYIIMHYLLLSFVIHGVDQIFIMLVGPVFVRQNFPKLKAMKKFPKPLPLVESSQINVSCPILFQGKFP